MFTKTYSKNNVFSYLNDLIAEVFKTTYQGRKLNNIERDLQSETINQFILYSSLKPASSGIRNLDFTDDIDLESEAFPCSHALCLPEYGTAPWG